MQLEIPNTNPLLDPTYAVGMAQRHFSNQLAAARDIVRYGVALFPRLMSVAPETVADLVLVTVVYKQALAALDAGVLCLENGAVYAGFSHGRSILEASLYVDWIRKDKDRRGRQFYVANLRQDLLWIRRYLPGRREEKAYRATWEAQHGREKPPTQTEISNLRAGQRRILSMLGSKPYKAIDADFKTALRGRAQLEPDWYRPGQHGAKSIYDMADKLGRLADYLLVYKYLSYFTHGSRTQLHTKILSNNTIEIEPIRYLKDFCLALSTLTAQGMTVYR